MCLDMGFGRAISSLRFHAHAHVRARAYTPMHTCARDRTHQYPPAETRPYGETPKLVYQMELVGDTVWFDGYEQEKHALMDDLYGKQKYSN